MLGSEWLKDGKFLAETNCQSFSLVMIVAVPTIMHIHLCHYTVSASRHARQPFQLGPTSGLPGPLWSLEPCPSDLPRLQSSQPRSRGGWACTCCPRQPPHASIPTGSAPGSRSHSTSQNHSTMQSHLVFQGEFPVRIPYSFSCAYCK